MPFDPKNYKIADAPAKLRTELDNFKNYLDGELPRKKKENLLLATWNIRCFSRVTEKWETDIESPKRNKFSILAIKEVIQRFDVVALQEVMNDIKALRRVMNLLGPEYGFIMTDVTRGDKGNKERLAFIFDNNRIKLSGLACEIVIAEKGKEKDVKPANYYQHQFARTPYAVSFVIDGKTFILVTLHVDFGDKKDGEKLVTKRKIELTRIAEWMRDWAKDSRGFGHNFLLLGDFNITHPNGELMDAFTSTGLFIPDELKLKKKTIFKATRNDNYYDQIAWFTKDTGLEYLNFDYNKGGVIEFDQHLHIGMSRNSLSYRISDHYPLWAEFKI